MFHVTNGQIILFKFLFLSDPDYMFINPISFYLTTSDNGTIMEMFSIDIVEDDGFEGDEMFNVTLSNSQNRIILMESTTTITILENDGQLIMWYRI